MKKRERSRNYIYYLLFVLGVILFFAGKSFSAYNQARDVQFQEDVAREIIRFHIIANSDSRQDQALKLQVKEKVVSQLQQALKNAGSIGQARKIILSQLTEIEDTARDVMKKNGYSYDATASLTKGMFPVKVYGDMVFPAGEYQALRVELGGAAGKNWWCVMFPTLCYVDGTYSVVPDKSKEKLQSVLTEEEYEALLIENKDKVEIRFRIMDWLKSITNIQNME